MRVLVLEDNETARFVLHAVLERAGFLCVEAEDGPQAVRLLGEAPTDLLIADASLPGADGIQVARELQQSAPGLPVLLISGYPLQQLQARRVSEGTLLEAGPTAFLQKPFTPSALLASIRALLDRHPSQQTD